MVDVDYQQCSGVSVSGIRRCQVSAQPPAKKTAGLIEKETDERRTSNVQHRTSNECILSVLKKISRSDSIPRHSLFCGSLFYFRVVSHELRRWPKSSQFNQKKTTIL
jgi:hypothetical protein